MYNVYSIYICIWVNTHQLVVGTLQDIFNRACNKIFLISKNHRVYNNNNKLIMEKQIITCDKNIIFND